MRCYARCPDACCFCYIRLFSLYFFPSFVVAVVGVVGVPVVMTGMAALSPHCSLLERFCIFPRCVFVLSCVLGRSATNMFLHSGRRHLALVYFRNRCYTILRCFPFVICCFESCLGCSQSATLKMTSGTDPLKCHCAMKCFPVVLFLCYIANIAF